MERSETITENDVKNIAKSLGISISTNDTIDKVKKLASGLLKNNPDVDTIDHAIDIALNRILSIQKKSDLYEKYVFFMKSTFHDKEIESKDSFSKKFGSKRSTYASGDSLMRRINAIVELGVYQKLLDKNIIDVVTELGTNLKVSGITEGCMLIVSDELEDTENKNLINPMSIKKYIEIKKK